MYEAVMHFIEAIAIIAGSIYVILRITCPNKY